MFRKIWNRLAGAVFGNIWKRLAGAKPFHQIKKASTHAVAGSSIILEVELVDSVIVRKVSFLPSHGAVGTCQGPSEKSAAAREGGTGQRSQSNTKN